MGTYNLRELLDREKELEIYKERIWDLPLWASIRHDYRAKYKYLLTGEKPMSNHREFNISNIFHSFFYSLWQLIKLFSSNKKASNLFLGFMRLEKIGDIYMDKFVDPILLSSNIADDYIYMERGRSGKHCPNRPISNIIWTESIDFINNIIGIITAPVFYLLYYKTFTSFFRKVNQICALTFRDKIRICNTVCRNLINILFLCTLYKKLDVKRVFAPVSIIHYKFVAACKRSKIPCYEIQHGITVGPTITYSGEYVEEAYPDYFLAFGKSSMRDFLFGLPIEKMINIGCAFKTFLKFKESNKLKNTYLFLSEPQITQKIVTTMVELAEMYPLYNFHLRLHPLERLNEEQQSLLCALENIQVVETVENSTIASMRYEGVVAENTTVLYEAVSVGVKAARLQYNGLHTIHFDVEPEGMFFYMQKPEDFVRFVNKYTLSVDNKELYYSSFDVEAFNRIIAK